MSDRYEVKSAIPMETGSVRDGVRQSTAVARGFQIFDNFENKRLPDSYMSRSEAQEECNRRNGK